VKERVSWQSVASFDVALEGLDWVSNYEKTRWFLVLRVTRPENDGLNRLLRISNRSLAAFGQPPLYEAPSQSLEPREKGKRGTPRDKKGGRPAKPPEQPVVDYSHCFHISIAWSLSEPSPEDKERVSKVDLRGLRGLTVHFSSVKAKIGNNVLNLALPTRKVDERGFAGLWPLDGPCQEAATRRQSHLGGLLDFVKGVRVQEELYRAYFNGACSFCCICVSLEFRYCSIYLYLCPVLSFIFHFISQ